MDRLLVDTCLYLRGLEDFSQRPHQCAVDPHELLAAHLVDCIVRHSDRRPHPAVDRHTNTSA
eukprot:scaffold406058_cov35-Prasinocladus_malaysianus.AAC.1